MWNDKEILSRFWRYYAIINREKIARYLITKKVQVSIEINASTPLEKLWDAHEHAAGKFKKLLQELDAQEDSWSYFTTLDTPQTSFLDLKIELAKRILRNCHFCERECQVNREETKGVCRLGVDSFVSSWFHHNFEEAPLIPSGTKN